jgi:hypothetical protein
MSYNKGVGETHNNTQRRNQMTITTTKTQTFVIEYELRVPYRVEVERPADITQDDLYKSITRDELSTGEPGNLYDATKDAWRGAVKERPYVLVPVSDDPDEAGDYELYEGFDY